MPQVTREGTSSHLHAASSVAARPPLGIRFKSDPKPARQVYVLKHCKWKIRLEYDRRNECGGHIVCVYRRAEKLPLISSILNLQIYF